MRKEKRVLLAAALLIFIVLLAVGVGILYKKKSKTAPIEKKGRVEKEEIKEREEANKEREIKKKEEEASKEKIKESKEVTFSPEEYKRWKVKVHYPENFSTYEGPLKGGYDTNIEYSLMAYKKKNNLSFSEALYLAYLGEDKEGVRSIYVQVNDEKKSILLITIDKEWQAECSYPKKSQEEIKKYLKSIGTQGEEIKAIQEKNQSTTPPPVTKSQTENAEETKRMQELEIREASEDLEMHLYGELDACIESLAKCLIKEKDDSSYVSFNEDLDERGSDREEYHFTVKTEKGNQIKVTRVKGEDRFICEKIK